MTIYIYYGGCYGDYKVFSTKPPTPEDLSSWKNGELEIFKVDSEMRVYQVHSEKGDWEILTMRN